MDEMINKRRLCAHADQNGEGAHWLEPGERCPQEPHKATTHITDAFIVSDSTCHYAWQDAGDPGMWVVTWAGSAARFDRNQAITAVTLAELAEQIRATGADGSLAESHELWPLVRDLSYEISGLAVADVFQQALAPLKQVKCAGTTAGAPACERDAVVTIYDSTGEPARVCAEHGTELLRSVIGTWVNWSSFTGIEHDRSALRITEERARIDAGGLTPADVPEEWRESIERDNARLPSADQINANAEDCIKRSYEQLEEALSWLRSDHAPVGSDLTNKQVTERRAMRDVIRKAKQAIEEGR